MNGALDHSDQPDPDAIKMFVGQIPRSWSEKELKELFEPYGAVYQINVLRDRSQNPPQSKGTDSRALARGSGACSPGLRGLGWGSWLFTGREEGEKDPPRCPCAPWPTGSSQRPCLPPGQVDQLASDAGREEQGAAAPLSRLVIPPWGHFLGSAGSSGQSGWPPRGIVFLSLAFQDLFLPAPPPPPPPLFCYCPCNYNCISLFRSL